MKRAGAALAGAAIGLGAIVSCAGPAAATPAGNVTPLVRSGNLAPLSAPKGAQVLGHLPPATRLGVDFVFRESDPSAVSTLITSLYDPRSPQFHRWLAPGEFSARFGPSHAEVSALDAWLTSVNLPTASWQGLVAHVDAPVARVSPALGVQFTRFQAVERSLPATGRRSITSAVQRYFFTADRSPLLPAWLASELVAVTGLDDVAHVHPELVPAADNMNGSFAGPAESSAPSSAPGVPPAQVGDHYGVGSLQSAGGTGSGQTIAVYELAAHSQSDVITYEQKYGFTNSVTTVRVDSGAPFDYATNGTEEADLDIEVALSQSPGARIVSYEGPQTGNGPVDIYAAMVNSDTAQVISDSWGDCETDYGSSPSSLAPYDQLFQQAATQGQTVVAASGDSGSEDCYQADGTEELAVDYPGSDPYVTDVGGTTMSTPDTVWNDCFDSGSDACASFGGGAGGGGMSDMYSKPSWQDMLDSSTWPTTAHPCGNDCRGVPDISANADPSPSTAYRIIYDGSNSVVGGTSAAAPLVAGIAADINDTCSSLAGDLAPSLYAYARENPSRGGLYGSAFTDVVRGNNDLTNTNQGKYPAGAGFDLAGGIGTPLAAGWACPEVASVSPSTADAGTQVTLAGSNLAHASIFFGNAAAAVDSASPTQATVTVPSGSGGTVRVTASTPLGTGVASATFTYSASNDHGSAGGSYWLLSGGGNVYSFGNAANFGSASFTSGQGGAAAMAVLPGGGGYWVVSSDGHVKPFGAAGTYTLSGVPSGSVVGIAATHDGQGYWLATSTGHLLEAGDATFYGSPAFSGTALAAPIVGIVSTVDGRGYWLLGADGGVFSYGDAGFHGSTGGTHLNKPVVAMAATADGGGYWFVASDGGVFSFGDAKFFGSMGGTRLNAPVIGMVVTPDGGGYWMVGSDGGVFTFGDAPFLGSTGSSPPPSPIVAMAGD